MLHLHQKQSQKISTHFIIFIIFVKQFQNKHKLKRDENYNVQTKNHLFTFIRFFVFQPFLGNKE